MTHLSSGRGRWLLLFCVLCRLFSRGFGVAALHVANLCVNSILLAAPADGWMEALAEGVDASAA